MTSSCQSSSRHSTLKKAGSLLKPIMIISYKASAAEGQQIALMTVQPLCTDEMFDLFWTKATQRATSLGIKLMIHNHPVVGNEQEGMIMAT